MSTRYLFIAIALAGCGASPSSSPPDPSTPDKGNVDNGPGGTSGGSSTGDGGGTGSSSSGGSSGSSGASGSDGGGSSSSGGGSSGGPITCSGPGAPKKNGGACGSERWDIKTGTDNGASSVPLVPQPTTIAQLVALPAAGGGYSRAAPVEKTLWELRDVTLSMIKLETDSDYHMVVSDGAHTMIVEVPYPGCAVASTWSCFVSHARSEVDAQLNVSPSPQYPALTVTVRGVGFFDFSHGQTGVAPNAIELHPVLELCFGKGCTPS